jgi:hypothetical protein
MEDYGFPRPSDFDDHEFFTSKQPKHGRIALILIAAGVAVAILGFLIVTSDWF